MVDVREVIAEAVPCNIVYGRPQAADEIIHALTAAGFRILGPDEVDPMTVEKCAAVADMQSLLSDTARKTRNIGLRRSPYAHEIGAEISTAIRSIGRNG